MEQVPHETVEARLARLEDELARLQAGRESSLRARPRRGLRRLLPTAGLIAMVLLLPLAVSASHQFADVPDGHTFHSDISWLYGSRITVGCGGGNYCPDEAVTRGQMAAFMRRGLPDADDDQQAFTIVMTNDEQTILTATVKAGTQTGGTAYALIVVTGVARATSNTGCPCKVEFSTGGLARTVQVPAVVDGFGQIETSITDVRAIPTGVPVDITVQAERVLGTGTVYAGGAISVITVYQ